MGWLELDVLAPITECGMIVYKDNMWCKTKGMYGTKLQLPQKNGGKQKISEYGHVDVYNP